MRNTCFSRRLHGLFTASSLTHEGLAQSLGVPVQIVRQWESGEKVPDINQFRKIAAIINMPYDWFLDDDTPTAAELAAYLGLGEDTVKELAALSEKRCDEILDILDDTIYMTLKVIKLALGVDKDA